jgi:hypothetical protein
MALPSALKLFIDPKLGLAFGNFSGSSQITKPSFTLGDTAKVEIYLVESTQVSSYPRQELPFPVSPGIKVAVGAIDEAPAAGTWTMSFSGDTTSALPYNATATQLQAALNALASITSAGGVTVSKIGDNYNIAFNLVGARTELTTDPTSLIPLSAATVALLQQGTASKVAISLVHLQRTVAGLATTFTQTEDCEITIESLGAWDGSKATFRLSISPDPKGGSFTISFDPQTGNDVSTSAIQVGASSQDVQNALNINSLVDKVTVTQVGAYAYDITVATQPGTAGLTANDAGLLSFSGYVGDLSLNTAEAISLLDGAESVETTLEVEITSDTKALTLLQIPCILKNAVIDVGSVQPLVLDTYLSQTTADGRYLRQSNNLSDLGSTSTARTNLGVYSTSQVDTALALKADVGHTHIIGNVTGLQTALDGKASSVHTHIIGDVTGLQTALDGKASLSGASFTGGVIVASTFTVNLSPSGGNILASTNSGSVASFTNVGVGLNDIGMIIYDQTNQTNVTIAGGNFFNTVDGNFVEPYARTDGTTFTGKVNTTATATTAPINIASQATSPSSTVAGDVWIGANINYKSWDGIVKAVANTNTVNQFSQGQAISVNSASNAFRINQQGTGAALVVEDSVNPDTTAFLVDASGNVGVGVNPATFTATNKVEVVGAIKASTITFDGTAQFKVNGTQSHTGGSSSHDLLISFNGSTYRVPMTLVSTP